MAAQSIGGGRLAATAAALTDWKAWKEAWGELLFLMRAGVWGQRLWAWRDRVSQLGLGLGLGRLTGRLCPVWSSSVESLLWHGQLHNSLAAVDTQLATSDDLRGEVQGVD